MLLIYLLVVTITGGSFWVFYSRRRRRPSIDDFFRKHYLFILLALLTLLVLLMVLAALNLEFNMDEVEHLHSAWYIQQQYLPYRDYFQHHHPLLWFLSVPLISIFGQSARLLVVFRLLMVLVTLGSGYLVYRIGRESTGSRESGILSVVLLFSMVMFVQYTVQIRPDVLQIFFGLLTVYFLVRFQQYPRQRYMIFSGLAAALSFLFLQKAIFFFAALGLVLLFFYFKRMIPLKAISLFAAACSLPLLFFLLYLILTGSWQSYLVTNWTLNITFAAGDTFTPWKYLNRFILKDITFWLLAVLSLGLVSLKTKRTEDHGEGVSASAFIGLFLVLTLFLYRRPHGHYFMFAIAMFSIPAGCRLAWFLKQFKLKSTHKVITILLLLVSPGFFITRITVNRNSGQLQRAQFVLDHSRPEDAVYDGDNIYNLFRRDLHYFWYSVKPTRGLDTYNRITGNRYGDYDIRRLIREKRPKFISDYHLDPAACGLDEIYRPTAFPRLYVRKDSTR